MKRKRLNKNYLNILVRKIAKGFKKAEKGNNEIITRNKADNISLEKLLSIRNKIFVCFLLPTIFIIIVGFAAYSEASDGMKDKFQESTVQTLNMAVDYIELGNTLIESKALEYAFHHELNQYASGMYQNDQVAAGNLMQQIREDMGAASNSNPFIGDIYIVTTEDITMATTKKSTTQKGMYKEYVENTPMDGKRLQKWIDNHELLDTHLEAESRDYIMAYQQYSQNKAFAVVFDIKADAIYEQLTSIDLGEGSIVGLVTENGREVIFENVKEGEEGIVTEGETVFFDKDFYQEIIGQEEECGANQVTFHRGKYLFIYSKSDVNHSSICALVPMKTVIGQAERIKLITIALVILAGIISSVIGIFIAYGIQKNMKNISGCLDKVAKGDLTVKVFANGNDEFKSLARSTANMVHNNKKLVQKVSNATSSLEGSALDVKAASEVINEYSNEISRAVLRINDGMSRQSSHAEECVNRTYALSDEIKKIGKIMSEMEALVESTEAKIREGMDMVHLLGERAQATTDITTEVGNSITYLQNESQTINKFVGLINDISEQTNLLSLNASIEAARAGAAGRGFSVVAEEIRKLADDSSGAANEIQKNVKNIAIQTQNSVQRAGEAQQMVLQQEKTVEDTIVIFNQMNQHMLNLIAKLREIMEHAEQAETERGQTLAAVRSISDIIENTAENAQSVSYVISQLSVNVDNLGRVSGVLEDNMKDLKNEVSVFKTEEDA